MFTLPKGKISALLIQLLILGGAAGYWCFQETPAANIAPAAAIPPEAAEIPAVREDFAAWRRFDASPAMLAAGLGKCRKNISPEQAATLGAFMLPRNWQIDFDDLRPGNFPLTAAADPQENTVRIRTGSKRIRINSCILRPNRARKIFLVYTAAGSGEIAAGCIMYRTEIDKNGICVTGYRGRKLLPRRLTPEWQTYRTEIDLFPAENGYNIDHFQLAMNISGDVAIKEAAAYLLPEAPADTIVEGTVAAVSAFPAPEKSPYADCNFTAEFQGSCIFDGARLPRKILLVIPAFRGRELLPPSRLKAGDRVKLRAVPFTALSDAEQAVQQADTLGNFALDNYYVRDFTLIKHASIPIREPENEIPFAPEADYVSPFVRGVNPPLPATAEDAQAEQIRADLAYLDARLQALAAAEAASRAAGRTLNDDFSAAWKKRQAGLPTLQLADSGQTLCAAKLGDSFYTLPADYQFLPPRPDNGEVISADNVKALQALRDFLRANGVQLIIDPVPDLFAAAARVLNPEFRPYPDFFSAAAARQLLAAGIETTYTADELVRRAGEFKRLFFYPADNHPHEGAQAVAAEMLSRRLSRFAPLFAEKLVPAADFRVVHDTKDHNDFVIKTAPPFEPLAGDRSGETAPYSHVLFRSGEVPSDPASPLLIVGNSYCWTPGWITGPLYPALLARRLRVLPQYLLMGASGANSWLPVMIFKEPEKYLKGKKVLILRLAAAHLTMKFVNLRELDARQQGK